MALMLNNAEVRSLLTIQNSMDALEDAYRKEAEGTAAYRPKAAVYVSTEPGKTALFVTQVGGLRTPPIFAVNIRSVVPEVSYRTGGFATLLFSGETGELLAMMNNRDLSSFRTSGTGCLAAREMARRGSQVVGIIGSGSLAHTHALGYARVRSIELFKIYSPNPEHRRDCARLISEETGVKAIAMDQPESVVRGSDIVALCTNSTGDVIEPDWIDAPGAHVTFVQLGDHGKELPAAGLKMFDRVVTNVTTVATDHFTDPTGRPTWLTGTKTSFIDQFDIIPKHGSLIDVLAGKTPGRESEDERNLYFSEGSGIQYAAMAAMVYQLARKCGVGNEVPPELAEVFMS